MKYADKLRNLTFSILKETRQQNAVNDPVLDIGLREKISNIRAIAKFDYYVWVR